MKTQLVMIGNIPSIIWGEPSDKIYIYVHGKMSCKENARLFAENANKKGYQTLSFDLPEHGERNEENYRCDIWNGITDLSLVGDYVFNNWRDISLFASSLGAFFSLHAYHERQFSNCLFHSPIVDMEYLIRKMFQWFEITEERLSIEKEIFTPIDTLSWDYFQYVLEHQITHWNIPTSILYGGLDNLQSAAVMQNFTSRFNCNLTMSKASEHAFMNPCDQKVFIDWLQCSI